MLLYMNGIGILKSAFLLIFNVKEQWINGFEIAFCVPETRLFCSCIMGLSLR